MSPQEQTMTATTPTLGRPGTVLIEHALHTAQRRAHRATVDRWLRALQLDTVQQLLDAIGGRDEDATVLMVREHQAGIELATTMLVGGKAKMLSAVSAHAFGETRDERLQVTVEAFLGTALRHADPEHEYLCAQLYWVTLRSVSVDLGRQHDARALEYLVDSSDLECMYAAVIADDDAVLDPFLSVAGILDWMSPHVSLSDTDRRALQLRFGGETVLPVREVAVQLGVKEDALETRLRRVMARVRAVSGSPADGLGRVLVDAYLGSVARDESEGGANSAAA